MKAFTHRLSVILNLPVVRGMLVGLALTRLTSEICLAPLSGLILLAIAIGAVVISYLILDRLTWRSWWPLAFLAIYIFWPGYAPWVGAIVFSAAVLLMLIANTSIPMPHWLPALGVFVFAFGLYWVTLSPGLLPADSGEFQLVTRVLGIAHPPGYALYTMLGKLFSLLPITDHAAQMNLMSALFSSLALAVMTLAITRVTGSALAGAVASATLGLGATFWVQSTTTNIRSLSTLFVVLLIAVVLEWERSRRDGLLVLLGLLFGLAVGHHASLAFLAPPIAVFLLVTDSSLLKQPRRWVRPIVASLLSLVILLYLPIRSAMSPDFDPSPIDSFSAFTSHVLATGFGGDMFYYRTLPKIIERVGIWWQIMRLELGSVSGFAVLIGLVVLVRRDWRKGLLLGGIIALNSLAAITYRAPQTVEYMLPTYVAAAFVIGIGFTLVKRTDGWHAVSNVALAFLLVAAVGLGVANWPDLVTLHNEDSTRVLAESLLHEVPENAVILAGWHQATPLWYLQMVEGLRPDVEVIYVYPEGSQDNAAVWLRRIDEELGQRPVAVTNWFYNYEQSGLTLLPLTQGWLVTADSEFQMPQDAASLGILYPEGVKLLGYDLLDQTINPGETVSLSVYWQLEGPVSQDYTLFAQLIGPQGVIAQGDHWHQTTAYTTNQVRADVFDMPLLLQTSPDDYALVCGFYYADASGWKRLSVGQSDTISLGSIRVETAERIPETLHKVSLPFEQGIILEGYDLDKSSERTRLYLHWSRRDDADLSDAMPMLRIVDGDVTLAQSDLAMMEPGTVQTLALDLPPGLGEVAIVLESEGQTLAHAGAWGLAMQRELSLSLGSDVSRYIPLGGEMVYLGMDDSVWDDGALKLEPEFLSLKPLLNDYTVSVGLRAPDGTEYKDDGTPGQGSIPTLKWLGGWYIIDPHRVSVPEGVDIEGWQRTLTVYDAFTLEPLAVLDDRLVREGQGVTLVDGLVPGS